MTGIWTFISIWLTWPFNKGYEQKMLNEAMQKKDRTCKESTQEQSAEETQWDGWREQEWGRLKQWKRSSVIVSLPLALFLPLARSLSPNMAAFCLTLNHAGFGLECVAPLLRLDQTPSLDFSHSLLRYSLPPCPTKSSPAFHTQPNISSILRSYALNWNPKATNQKFLNRK